KTVFNATGADNQPPRTRPPPGWYGPANASVLRLRRSNGRQAPDSRGINVVGPGDIGLCLAGSKASQSFLPLMCVELTGPAEPDTAFLGALAAFAGASADQLPFKLGKAAKDCKHQPAMRAGRVRPCILQGLEASAALGHGINHVQKVPR